VLSDWVLGRWFSHMQVFGGSAGLLSETFYQVLRHVDSTFCDQCLSTPERYAPFFPEWAEAVARAAALDPALYPQNYRDGCGVIGFVDGTVRPICRPTTGQEYVYSGHKRLHGLKFQSVMTPCGIIMDLAGAYPGCRHDMTAFAWSGVDDALNAVNANRLPGALKYVLYGDSAYSASSNVHTAYPRPSAAEHHYNVRMNAVRTSVEWVGPHVASQLLVLHTRHQRWMLPFLDFSRGR
jgi:hypothetical protein